MAGSRVGGDAPQAPAALPPDPAPAANALAQGPVSRALHQQLLIYTPDGPLGGTFTCTACAAQAWQPDLLDHAAACPYRPR